MGMRVVLGRAQRISWAVRGGIGRAGAIDSSDAIAHAFLEGGETDDPAAETFYRFASARPINDLRALAACIQGLRPVADPARLAAIRTPILIVVGDRDEIARGAPELVELIPSARLVTVPGRERLSLVPAAELNQAPLY